VTGSWVALEGFCCEKVAWLALVDAGTLDWLSRLLSTALRAGAIEDIITSV
jgi:hypothetical protein